MLWQEELERVPGQGADPKQVLISRVINCLASTMRQWPLLSQTRAVGGRIGALKLNQESQNRQRVCELTSGDDHNGVSGGCTRRPHPPRCHTKPIFQDLVSAQSLRSADTEGGAVR